LPGRAVPFKADVGRNKPDDGPEGGCYIAPMSNKRSLLILCARIGYNPPRR
jgi:hypothetical protein